jgi:type IVB pilus formation R64 PilN family outer membrane protein
MSTKKMKAVLLSCAAAIALSACQGTEQAAKQNIATDAMEGNIAKQAYKQQQDNAGPGNVRYHDDVWLGSEASRSSNGMPLPAIVETKDAITLSSANPMTLIEVTKRISMASGIEVNGANQLGISRSGTPDLNDPNEDPRHIQAVIDYTGPMSGLLDMVASKFGVSWEYRGGVVRIFDFETKSFTLVAAPIATEIKNEIKSTLSSGSSGGGSDSGSGGSTAQQSDSNGGVKTTATLDYWKRVEKDVENLLPQGTSWSVSPESGAVTVTARPDVLQRVAQYVKDQNTRMTRQVAISVKVLSISEDESEGFSADMDLIFEDASKNIGASFTALAPGIATAGTALTGTLTGSKFEGSKVLLQALSKRGDVSLVTSGSATTMNNQPAPIQVSQETAYISGYSTQTTNDTTIITPDTSNLTTGFSMSVLPRILPNNTVALNYNVGISALDDLKTVGSGDYQVQTPEVSARGFQQNVMLRSGDTLILGGFERMENNVDKETSGILNWLIGGKRSAEKKHDLIVLMITPVIIENPADLAKMQ